ncbi:hypothetical protein SLS56_002976 [Neofusicoccum ribis]|uniref:Helicase C-terminal domain-containing protein n=1 Tax=Neofusicoccum ribis TaxID=45134 RepID=A0ABR3T198_9PEZI
MPSDIRSYLTSTSRRNPTRLIPAISPPSSDDDLVLISSNSNAPKKRTSAQAQLPSRSREKKIGVFSHVAIPVRPKKVRATFQSEPTAIAVPTPTDSSDDVKMSIRPQRTRGRRISYAVDPIPSSDEESDAAKTSDFEESHVEDTESLDEYNSDVEQNTSPEPQSDVDEDIMMEDEQADPMDLDEPKPPVPVEKPKRAKAKSSKPTKSRGIDPGLPPLSDIHDIFKDITERALNNGFLETLGALQGRELRIATMCSGTESPVLALQLVSEALEQSGNDPLRLRHAFSAEIVPKKQAYIERNFRPPIIFRDIRELAREDALASGATNAYGAKVQVPGSIDLLVAGFSCVDFSALNNKGKTIDQKGESRDTLEAILAYAKQWKPKIIVLENVYGAPWDDCVKRADAAGYAADYVRVDTKDYYLPQTRTRGYMVCIHRQQFPGNVASAVKTWKELMFEFKRRASAPASAFLLPADDYRVHHFNSQLTTQYRQENKDRAVNWDACRHRHQKVRSKDGLGNQRPITQWIDNGSCVPFENSHKMWFSKQVERVWDSIEIRFLRAAMNNDRSPGYDPMFKTSIMELSQNVDRFNQEMPFGVCSCITPSGIFFLTDRGGPLTPYETLALQGLPLDKISFTIETMRELQDLAGNAMSSTVVGVAQLAALIVAAPMLKERPLPTSVSMPTTTATRVASAPCNEEDLTRVERHELMGSETLSPGDLCEDARNSNRLCRCEGQFGMTRKEILECQECGHTVCAECKSKPAHVYSAYETNRSLTAHGFELKWKAIFPASLEFVKLPGITSLARDFELDMGLGRSYFEIVERSLNLNEQLRFRDFKRTSKWIVSYESASAVLKLEITSDDRAEWRLFAKAPRHLPGNDPIRKVLEMPVARAMLPERVSLGNGKDLWAERWKWFIPSSQNFPISIREISPEANRSWRALYGLVSYLGETVPQQLEVSVPLEDVGLLPEDVSGTYLHLPACGTACSALYRRISPSLSDGESGPLYLFLHPSRIGSVDEDSFVFSRHHERLEMDERRDVIAWVDSSFRPWDRSSYQTSGSFAGSWTPENAPETLLCASSDRLIINRPSSEPGWGDGLAHSCSHSLAVLSMKFHTEERLGRVSTYRFDEEGKSTFMEKFSWVLGTNAHIPCLKEWRRLHIDAANQICEHCAPALPSIKWAQAEPEKGRKNAKNAKIILVPQEDPKEAAQFEFSMKTRPSILDMMATVDESGNCHLRVGVNLISLAHRALALLCAFGNSPSVSWNITTEFVPAAAPSLLPFRLLNNLDDPQHSQPNGFLLDLRPAQKRSLSWMRKQEEGQQFFLQEVAEEVVEQLRWKIEAKAEFATKIKGGVVADQVSYGKTITSLALIHMGFCKHQRPPSNDTGLIPLKATLVLVPNNLPNQWMAEVRKCLPMHEYAIQEVLVIKSAKDLENSRIEQFQRAKIIIAPYSLLGKEAYADRLGNLTAMPEPPADDRPFNAWFEYARKRIPQSNQKLREVGVASFKEHLKYELEKTLAHEDFQAAVPSRRTKGANYKSFEETKHGKSIAKGNGRGQMTAAPQTPANPKDDWAKMKFPVLHQFTFNRIIIDEFHYPRGKEYATITTLSADKRWILSGTPPLDDFADVKRFAAFLGINLGIDWDAPGVVTQENSRQLRREKTSFELFQIFKERRSPTWHERRHRHAQDFLDKFARQNFAEIGDVKCFEMLRAVELTLDHRALYEELSSYVKGRNMATTKLTSSDTGDRASRLRHSLRSASTAEEALLQCSSAHVVQKALTPAYDTLVRQRELDLEKQRRRVKGCISEAADLAKRSGDPDDEWKNWAMRYRNDGVDAAVDGTVDSDLQKMVMMAERESASTMNERSARAAAELKTLVRNKVGAEARKFMGMSRSLRYVRSVKHVNTASSRAGRVRCHCGSTLHEVTASDTAVLIGCGHIACGECLTESLDEERCVVEGCEMEIRENSVLHANNLRHCGDITPWKESFGAKLDAVMDLLDGIPDEEQGIIFVQSYSMMGSVCQALTSRGIPSYAIDRISETASDKIEAWVSNKKYLDAKKTKVNSKFGKVLILNLGDESASGMNLVNANHVIFIAPLLTNTNQKYQAAMVQSIGRARRYGQQKPVHVYRFVAPKTIDMDILEQRELRNKALSEEPQDMAPPFEPGSTDYEKTKVIKDAHGTMMIVPRSWVADVDTAGRHGIELGVSNAEELERFTSITQFSEAYVQDGDV